MTALSREAERTSEAIYSAELDLEAKLAAQRQAEDRQRAEFETLTAAQADLRKYQDIVNRVAAASYMGGSTSGISAAPTAESPQRLLGRTLVESPHGHSDVGARRGLSSGINPCRECRSRGRIVGLGARTAAEQASAVRVGLQAEQSRLRTQIGDVEALYRALTPDQRAAPADPGPVPPQPPSSSVGDPAIVAMPDAALPPVTPGPSGSAEGTAVVQAALTRVGSPYSWGATGPNALRLLGAHQVGIPSERQVAPRSSQALAAGGQPVATPDVQPGDIVAFYSDASYAGIYIGDGNMVHAWTYGTPVKVAPISSAPIYTVRRF